MLQAFGVGVRLVGNAGDPTLYAFAKFVGFGAQLIVREFLNLGLKRIDRSHTRPEPLDFAIVPGPKNLAEQCVDQI